MSDVKRTVNSVLESMTPVYRPINKDLLKRYLELEEKGNLNIKTLEDVDMVTMSICEMAVETSTGNTIDFVKMYATLQILGVADTENIVTGGVIIEYLDSLAFQNTLKHSLKSYVEEFPNGSWDNMTNEVIVEELMKEGKEDVVSR